MMTVLRRGGLLAVALLVLVSTACNVDSPASPAAQAAPATELAAPVASPASQDLLGGVLGTVGAVTNALGLTNATGVLRTTPLASSITVRKTIGRNGGVLSIPQAGVLVLVPRGALDQDTEITMTARAGSL